MYCALVAIYKARVQRSSAELDIEDFCALLSTKFKMDTVESLDFPPNKLRKLDKNLLAMVFDPNNKFNRFKAMKQSKSVPTQSNIPDDKLYARPPADPTNPSGWLVDLINKFGYLGGFTTLLAKFQSFHPRPTIPVTRALLRPFGLCHELLTVLTIDTYLLPIVESVREFLDNLTDEELKKAAQSESFSHDISSVMKTMISLASRVPQHKDIIVNLESTRLKMILRLLDIVKNIQELLGDIVNNLRSSEGLDNFFQGFQRNWTLGGTEEREKLLYFIRRLLAYDKNSAMMDKVLTVFWNVAHSDDVSTEVMELALKTHLELLDHPSTQDREALKNVWLDKCAEELKNNDNWALPAIKQIRDICNSLFESQANRQPDDLINYKQQVIACHLLEQRLMLDLIIDNLKNYMNKVRKLVRKNPEMDGTIFLPDGRYNHVMGLQERLNVLTFLLKEGDIVLCIDGVKPIWQCLGEQPVFPSDREACLKWFIELISAELPCIKATDCKDIFERVIHQLDPKLLAETGFTFFEKFFKAANIEAVTDSQEDIARRGIELLMQVHKNLGRKMLMTVAEFQITFVEQCTNRLQDHCNVLSDLAEIWNLRGNKEKKRKNKIVMQTVKINRIKEVLKEYVNQCKSTSPKIHVNRFKSKNRYDNERERLVIISQEDMKFLEENKMDIPTHNVIYN